MDFLVKMSILGGKMAGNGFFRSKMDKNKVPDHSSTPKSTFLPKNPHFTLYFGYRGAKITIFGSSIEIYSDKVNFGKFWVVSKYKMLKIIQKVRANTLEVEK